MRRLKSALLAVLAVTVTACSLVGTSAAAGPSDSILVKVEPQTDVRDLADRYGMDLVRYLPEIRWAQLEPRDDGESQPSAASTARSVGADPDVRSIDTANSGEMVEWDFVPRDPVFSPGLVYTSDGVPVAWHFAKANFPAAWDLSLGVGVTVAVIDSEFDTTNPDLQDKLVSRYNAVAGSLHYRSGNVEAQPGDVFHGSHTSGLVGARTDNGMGVAGACFECGVMAIKVGSEASGTFVDAAFLGDVAEGIIVAANSGATVINMSLGSTRPHQPLLDAVNYAASKGVVIVASAGNGQQSNPGVAHYPAAYPNVIAVGATNSLDQNAPFSSQGSYVDLVAPGERVLSTTDASDPELQTLDNKVAVSVKSGTSMSAPLVAGLAALMRSVRPDLSPAEVEGLMKATARDLGFAGHDLVYGAGRIEALAAVAAARAYVRPAPPPPPAPAPPAPKRKRKPAKRIAAFTLLDLQRGKGKLVYSGKVATKPRCRSGRKVLLLEKGTPRPLARAQSNARGNFRIVLRKAPRKKVQAKVMVKRVGARAFCKASKSNFVKVR